MATRHPLPFSSADTTANTSVFVNVSRVNIESTILFILRRICKKTVKDTLEERIFSVKVVYWREWADTLFAKVRTRRPPAANLCRASPVAQQNRQTGPQLCNRSVGQVIYGENGFSRPQPNDIVHVAYRYVTTRIRVYAYSYYDTLIVRLIVMSPDS